VSIRIPSLFLSVCLGVLERDNPKAQAELARIGEKFLARTGWRPTQSKTIAGALLYSRYNSLIRWAMRRIVAKAGGDTDTSRDYEYTDWDDLKQTVETLYRETVAPLCPA